MAGFDLDKFIADTQQHLPISEDDLITLFAIAADIFYQEGTIMSLSAPITVCGDVHGQFYDLLFLLEIAGDPKSTKYLFLGDYVDRGYYSVETVSLLIAYKVKYPTTFFLLRGNHECRQVNQMYGFYEEIVNRFGHAGPYKMCNELFDYLPMAALISDKIFCVHGGLSPDIRAVEQIAAFDRLHEIRSTGPMSDLCWSDPDDNALEWATNQRGAGFVFGRRPSQEFCHANKLNIIARAHQLADEGYKWHFDPDHQVVTVWSAPNYMYRCGNKASVMFVPDDLDVRFTQFDAVPLERRKVPGPGPVSPYFT
jgi:diadenosine tetraphosphatase ApaH/serine/threonine PP2A family protein phosphatase